MPDLITYVHDMPVRKDGVSYQQILKDYARYVATGLAPEEVRDLQATISALEERLLNTSMKLSEYEQEGTPLLFRLLKNKYRNEVYK